MYHNLPSHPRESWSRTHLLQLSHYQITTQICGSPLRFPLHLSAPLYQHCSHSTGLHLPWAGEHNRPHTVFLSWILFILFLATAVFLQKKIWALCSSPYKLPCCLVAFSLKSKLLRMSCKAPQLRSVAPSPAASFTLYPLILSDWEFLNNLEFQDSLPFLCFFSSCFLFLKHFFPSYLVSYPLTLITSFHFSKPSQASLGRDENFYLFCLESFYLVLWNQVSWDQILTSSFSGYITLDKLFSFPVPKLRPQI